MTANELRARYFDWVTARIYDKQHCQKKHYNILLNYLYGRMFTYIIDLDENRLREGLDLRFAFGDSQCYDPEFVAKKFDGCQCNVLEMMVALAIHCEQHIMDNPDIGDRTANWFWGMIRSLGLSPYDDNHFNYKLVEGIVDRFLDRRYDANGRGGLFTVTSRCEDLRSVEIWYQMCWYLDQLD